MVSLAPLDALATQLAAVEGIRSASTDPAKIVPPGVFVACGPITIDRLDDGCTIEAQLRLVVADNGLKRSREALVALLNRVLTVVDPDGPMTPQGVILPGSPASLPGLTVPVLIESGA